MFRTLTGRRAVRGMAVGALILSLTTGFSGNASAAPLTDETSDPTRGCSVLAHERNEGVHRLHDAWAMFNDDLRELQRDARQLDREAKKTKSASTMTSEAREALDGAKAELQKIRSDAHAAMQELIEQTRALAEGRRPTPEVFPGPIAQNVIMDWKPGRDDYSEEELKMLVTASQEAGVLEETEEQMLHRVFDFADLTAGQVMVPRNQVRYLDLEDSL